MKVYSAQTDYGIDNQEAETVRYLDRWRLEVKDKDVEKFKNGELVEPKKPIVYYLDPATPEKWEKYLKMELKIGMWHLKLLDLKCYNS